MKFSSLPLLLLAGLLAACGTAPPDPVPPAGALTLEMEHVVGSAALRLNAATTPPYDYQNASGEAFNVSHFHYFISNIRLQRADGTEYVQPDSYYLVEESVPDTRKLVLGNVPVGDYTGISFLVGVDAAHNTAGQQQGVLAPSPDTFWSWTTGYIFVKLEGYSPAAPGSRVLQFHIGGFEAPYNAIRAVAPAFPAGSQLAVRAGRTPAIHLRVDVLRMLQTPNPVQFSSFAIPHGPGANAVKIADNYAGMFSIQHLRAN